MVYAYLGLSPYNTLSELSLVLYDVSVIANSSQLGGMDYINGTVAIEVRDTNYTCTSLSLKMKLQSQKQPLIYLLRQRLIYFTLISVKTVSFIDSWGHF